MLERSPSSDLQMFHVDLKSQVDNEEALKRRMLDLKQEPVFQKVEFVFKWDLTDSLSLSSMCITK